MKRILIIEDNQVIANIYRGKFTREGFKVETAFDGEVGFEMVKAFRPDVIILDLMLPKISGLELIKLVRSRPEFKRTPILVFSNAYLTNLVQQAWQAGATQCLSKSDCTPRHLVDAVLAAIRSSAETGTLAERTTVTAPVPTQTDHELKPTVVWQLDEDISAVPDAGTDQTDAEFQAALRREFVASLPETLATLRAGLKGLTKAGDDSARVRQLQALYDGIHPLTESAPVAGLVHIAQMADATEVLLKELIEKPKNLNPSSMRTVANAVDFLAFLFEHGTNPEKQAVLPPRILVVDDEAISRRAVTYALEKAKLKSESCSDPNQALSLLGEGRFDLVFLDVDMPGMNGFELCTKLRAMPQHKKTPVVFVTSLNDFDSRANSTMSGGNDFIGKPFLFIELAVKALIHVLRGRLTPAG